MWSATRTWVLPILAVAALFAVTRLPSIPFYPLNVDEAIHSATAVRCTHLGKLPYVGAVGNKGPLQYWTYQLIFLFAGDYNLPTVHLLGAIIVALNTAMVWHISWRCFGRFSGPWAAAMYLLAMGSFWSYLAFNSELPASLPLVAANWMVLTARRPLGVIRCLLVGALVLVSAGYRQNCLVAYPVACVGVMALSWWGDRRVWPAIRRAALVGVGGLIPVAVVLAIYARAGALEELYFGYFGHNTSYYIKAVQLSVWRVIIALWQLSSWVNMTAVLSLLSLVGLVPVLWRVGISRAGPGDAPDFLAARPQGLYLAGLTLVLWWSLSVGWRFFYHYRMIDWPFTAVLAAGGWMLLRGHLRHGPTRVVFKIAVIVALAALGIRGESSLYLPSPLARAFAPIDVDPHTRQVAHVLKTVTTCEESLFVWGAQPQIYLLAERRMATRFAQCSPQVGLIQYENYQPPEQDRSAFVWPGSFEQMMSDLRADPPAYVVDASRHPGFVDGQFPIHKYSQLQEWLQAGYVYDFEVFGPAQSVLVVYRQRGRNPTDTSPEAIGRDELLGGDREKPR